jgi:hypothetical protein
VRGHARPRGARMSTSPTVGRTEARSGGGSRRGSRNRRRAHGPRCSIAAGAPRRRDGRRTRRGHRLRSGEPARWRGRRA